ncbi:MAG: radical SAM protein [Minisyncoccia bacterium]
MSKITLLYPPQQTLPNHAPRPEAALAYPYLAGALLDAGHEVKIYDACVGNDSDLEDVFYRYVEMESGLRRHGVSDDRILEEVADSDVVGITSIFTAQETMAVRTGELIKEHFPEKLLITGGTNARSRADVFVRAGFDVVCLGEAEYAIVHIANQPSASAWPYTFADDLDELPIPAWHLHANERYWSIGRPHGAPKQDGKPFRYAPLMTSRGCVFKCGYCHISGENGIGRFRVKSTERVQSELERLKELGVTEIFIEDDSLLAHKRRGMELLRWIRGNGFRMWDINGINLSHLFRRGHPDTGLIGLLQECGFAAISLPVESGTQRIIDHYGSSKWRLDRCDVTALIHCLSDHGIAAGINYMIGFPDETIEEIQTTISLAREHMAAGAASANFMLVIPLPGTALHDEAIAKGYLDKDFDPDTFNWRQASMKNTTVPPEQLEAIQHEAWEELNGDGT